MELKDSKWNKSSQKSKWHVTYAELKMVEFCRTEKQNNYYWELEGESEEGQEKQDGKYQTTEEKKV